MMKIFRMVYVVVLCVTLCIEGTVAVVLTWFYTLYNNGSYKNADCPGSKFTEYDVIDVLQCPMDYAIKVFILDSAAQWSSLQDIW